MTPLPETYTRDPYRRWDAAYILGALPPTQRLEYEDHLAFCSGCRGGVLELAGLPGLLARLRPDKHVSDNGRSVNR